MNAEKLFSPILAASAPTTLARQLLESWKDPEYRAEFVRVRVKSSVALQIRALREQRNGMTQKQLGDAIGKAQTWISVLEDPEYGKMSVATLLSLAQAFGTDLEIKFRPFSRALHELTRQGPDYFEVRGFDEELPDLENAATLRWITPSGKWSDILRAAQLLANVELMNSFHPAIVAPSGGVLQSGPEITQAGPKETASTIELQAMNEPPLLPLQVYRSGRSRKHSRLTTRRREIIWRKRKLPKRVQSNQGFSGGVKTMNPSMQTAFTFSQASGI